MATKKKRKKVKEVQRLVKSTFTVTLVEYITNEASPSTAFSLEEHVNDMLRDFNGNCLVRAVGKPVVIAGV